MTERTIFLAAIDISDPAERAAYVEKTCGGDAKLRAQVEQLLRHHEVSSQFLEKPAGASSSAVEMTIVSNSADEEEDQNSSGMSGEEELRKYLQPTSRPGWLGQLAHYEIEQILGRGAFGIVVKAFDEKLHRIVAIKLMNPELASTSPPRKRFLREARTAAAVRNEYIVGIHAVEEEPLPYLVMEYVSGMTLQQRLDQNGPLELSEILQIGQQVSAGLAAAHAANLIHRDIKPSNILLESGIENRAKISDFGLARAVDDASLTTSGLIAGTPMYMAPEQARGEVLDHRADLFSLGSVLYQMVSGRPPFRASNTVAVLKRVCEDTPRPIEDVIPGTPDWLCTIIMRLLEKKPADRFQTAKEVADLFARCQAELQLNGHVTCVQSHNLARRDDASPSGQSASPHESTQPSATEHGSSRRNEMTTSKRSSMLYGILLGVMMLLPILFGKQLSSYMNAWIWPAIPTLPAATVSGGLEFDGKDDFVSVEAVGWSYPQFTIEAFVTSASDSDNGTIVHLGSGGENPEWMSIYDDHQADLGKRLSGAAIQGKTPFANASAPITTGVRQHRVLVFDGRFMHYYVNGIWQAKRFAEAHEGLMWKMKNLRIGCDGTERRFFQGRIDQVRISRIARYDNNFAPIASLTSDDSTLALYNFDEGTGDVLRDATGNGHDGKIVGAKWVRSKAGNLSPGPQSPTSATSGSLGELSQISD
ncbi:MAG: protein kinase [Planctomyces sp.]|nr:protein kinase [Planctomyces sp.]